MVNVTRKPRFYIALSMVVSAFFMFGCTLNHKQDIVLKTQNLEQNLSHPIKQNRVVNSFSQINAQGKINLNLYTGYNKSEVILSGDPRDLAEITTFVKGTTLYIKIKKGFPRFGVVSAEIKSKDLNTLRYKGAGLVKGTRLNTRFLELYLHNEGTTQLAGNIGLQRLVVSGYGLTQISNIISHDMVIKLEGAPRLQLAGFASLSRLNISGGGWLSFYWIKSNHLTITARKDARIQLAGIVNRLEVELWDNAHFKGRYLRAQRSFVKTHNRSVAELSSVNHQSSLATDASDIYYYNIPTTRADFMAVNGSVLNMREWSYFDRQDFNRYNKQFP